ncbi:L,D-transpeptidase [Pseudofrankia inefficax]|uniref:L,D-transpeptidase n=1 Tax=Pseudofrankia inefficax (strain DSM 45817 / CECT 9037 / DDB 130130 / EuI1c) TaxID=298654 RepID=UPI0002F96FB6|nr:L,D-transpeptidase [Pseudofrankia inefficax]
MTVAAGLALAGCGGGHSPVAGPKPSVSASPTRPVAKPRAAGLDPAHLPAGWSLVAWPAAGTIPVFGQSAPVTNADAPTSQPSTSEPPARQPPATQAPAVAPVGRSAEQPTSTLANPNAEGAPLVLLVKHYQPDWLQVSLPVRPNGSTGWIRTKDTRLTATPFALTVDKTRHELTVFKDGKPSGVYPVGIGTGTTPTPLGHFYLAELLKPANPAGPWGPYAFGLSGFSDVITNFDGGNGIIGLHGTNQPDRVGTDVSMGCIRLRNSDITALAALLPVGTPVTIT